MSEQPCAFHADRLTRVQCSRCERPICTDDMFPAAVGVHCPICAGRMREGALGRTGYEMRSRVERTPLGKALGKAQLTTLILAANVVVFLLMFLTREGITTSTLIERGALLDPLPPSQRWRLLTSMFIHVNLLHLAFNMFALMMFGTPLEERYGKLRFLGLYLVSGLMGGAFTLAFGGFGVSAGASGAIFGIMGALLAVVIRHRMQEQLQSLLILLGINFVLGLSSRRINMLAHIGGLVAGFVLAWCLEQAGRARGNAKLAIQVAAYVGLTTVALILVVAQRSVVV
jgi:membrane associated rhomboid family serine protease